MKQIRVDRIETMEDVRDALQQIKEALDSSVIERGEFKFFKLTFTAAVTNYRYTHNLTFSPTDVIELSVVGSGSVTWNYALFNKQFLDLTVSGPCVVRAYVGRHREGAIS